MVLPPSHQRLRFGGILGVVGNVVTMVTIKVTTVAAVVMENKTPFNFRQHQPAH